MPENGESNNGLNIKYKSLNLYFIVTKSAGKCRKVPEKADGNRQDAECD